MSNGEKGMKFNQLYLIINILFINGKYYNNDDKLEAYTEKTLIKEALI